MMPPRGAFRVAWNCAAKSGRQVTSVHTVTWDQDDNQVNIERTGKFTQPNEGESLPPSWIRRQ